jgi:hypothetical protein
MEGDPAGAAPRDATRDAAPAREPWTEDSPPVRSPPRFAGIALALVASGCLIAACFSHRWLANRHLGDLGYSPLSYADCRSTCQVVSNFQVYENAKELPFEEDRVARMFPIAGAVTFALLLIAAASLLAAAAIAVSGRRPDLPVSPTTIALLGVMLGLLTGCVFVATKPGAVGLVGVGWSFWAFGIGSVAGIAGAQLLAKQLRPADPDLLHDAMNPDQF